MSRDFTPRELFLADKLCEAGGQSLREMRITMTTPEGKDVPMFEEQKALQERFPNLGFLFERLPDLYKSSHFPKSAIDAFVGEVEKNLTTYIQFDCITGGKMLADIPETLVEWFHGHLDPGFYYHERNDELFLEWLTECLTSGKQ